MSPQWRNAVILTGCLVLGAIGITIWRQDRSPLPERVGDLVLISEAQGESAREIVDRMHGKGVSPKQSNVGTYQSQSARADIYLSTYANTSEAQNVYRVMAERIGAGGTPFFLYQNVAIAGQSVSFCLGLGQAHYFFVRSEQLYWVSADAGVAQNMITELMKILDGART